MDRRSLILLGAFALAGCATTRRPVPAPALSTSDIIFQALEPLLAASSGPQGLVIRMASNGCTTKIDIAFHVEMRNGAAYVAFARRRLDGCKAGVGDVEVSFSYEELGVRPDVAVFLLNPINAL